MDYISIFPFGKKLNHTEKIIFGKYAYSKRLFKGTRIHLDSNNSYGLVCVLAGQMRVFMTSEDGKEVTLFRLYKDDVCTMGSCCLLDSVTSDVTVEVLEDTDVVVLPSNCLDYLTSENKEIEAFVYRLVNQRLSNVMDTMRQVLFRRIDNRIADFLYNDYKHSHLLELKLTHDEIARNIGSAREVVTKVLKYLADEQILELKRGRIIIKDLSKLKEMAN